MNWGQVCAIGTKLPGVTIDTWYRTPALKVAGKGFVRLREDGKSVAFVLDSVDEQEALIDAKPNIYFMTDHYRGYAMVPAHLAKLTEPAADAEEAWNARDTARDAALRPGPAVRSRRAAGRVDLVEYRLVPRPAADGRGRS